MRALAIDQGTSATKAVVVDTDAGILSDVDSPVTGTRFDGAAVEQDPEALWQSVVEAGRQALAAGGGGVDCVGIGNQGETVLGWRRSTGEPVTTALVWQDRRAVAVTDRLADRADALHRLTGLPLDPYFAAPKMTWLREHLLGDDERRDPDVVVTTIDAWVLRRACGAYATDASTASRTLLLDVDAVAWDRKACDWFGLDVEALPRVVGCDGPLGETAAFGPRLPVTGAVVDQQAALFAQRGLESGDAKCTYGTGAFLLAQLGTTALRSGSGLATSVAWSLRGEQPRYCVDGQVYTVGSAVRWLERVGLVAEPADVDRLGLAVPDAGGVVFVPSLAGVGAPRWEPSARGAFAGLSLSTRREHLVHAVAEGIAAQVAMLAHGVEADLGAPLHALRVDGGLTRSRLVMQRQADLLGVPVEVYPHPCATALGVAAFALRGHAGPGAEDAVVQGWAPSAVYEPTWSRDQREERYGRWLAALEATLGDGLRAAAGGPP